LSGDDRNDRDLRLVQGSALDRLLSDKGLRSRMASELAKNDVKNELTTEAQAKLKNPDTAFQRGSLPAGLDLAITGGQGASIASMVGLTADRSGIQLPLASWGAGTRRLSALAIAEQNQGDAPITLVDEVERGLEPYRQRMLIEKLQSGSSQVFLTTHSPAAISAAATSSIWYVDHIGQIGPLDATKIAKHRKTDPEAFLSRLAVVAEGATELGFTTAILERAFGSVLEQHGAHVSDGGGHETTLGILEALAGGGLRFGGFADDEGKHPTRWAKLHTKLGALLFRWPSLCIEENIIAVVSDDKLEAFITVYGPVRIKTVAFVRVQPPAFSVYWRRKELESTNVNVAFHVPVFGLLSLGNTWVVRSPCQTMLASGVVGNVVILRFAPSPLRNTAPGEPKPGQKRNVPPAM
jgi:putative ATP-dependent endonuclease of the OLD family